MKDKLWEVDFEGHKIKAINKVSLFPPRTSEALEIDGELVEHVKGSMYRMCSNISVNHTLSGKERNIEVRMAQKTGRLGTGCQIFIDGTLIGGDNAIRYPDPEKTQKKFEKGFIHHLLSTGLLHYGLPYACMMTVINLASMGHNSISIMMLLFIFYAVFFGSMMSYFSWQSIKGVVSTAHAKNTRDNSRT
ncbi:hypothetical protein [Agaribacterium sp. ZY112]|uniref:hypothetical protein n=1 Tax=Agaribacterium sp. ZY112 TaxID=3233574 RepID=UPI0035256533